MGLPKAPTDRELEELLDLEAIIRPMKERIDELKLQCKEAGSFCTANYVCTVSSQNSTRIASLEEVKAVLGIDLLERHDLIRVSSYKIVRVTEHAGIIL